MRLGRIHPTVRWSSCVSLFRRICESKLLVCISVQIFVRQPRRLVFVLPEQRGCLLAERISVRTSVNSCKEEL